MSNRKLDDKYNRQYPEDDFDSEKSAKRVQNDIEELIHMVDDVMVDEKIIDDQPDEIDEIKPEKVIIVRPQRPSKPTNPKGDSTQSPWQSRKIVDERPPLPLSPRPVLTVRQKINVEKPVRKYSGAVNPNVIVKLPPSKQPTTPETKPLSEETFDLGKNKVLPPPTLPPKHFKKIPTLSASQKNLANEAFNDKDADVTSRLGSMAAFAAAIGAVNVRGTPESTSKTADEEGSRLSVLYGYGKKATGATPKRLRPADISKFEVTPPPPKITVETRDIAEQVTDVAEEPKDLKAEQEEDSLENTPAESKDKNLKSEEGKKMKYMLPTPTQPFRGSASFNALPIDENASQPVMLRKTGKVPNSYYGDEMDKRRTEILSTVIGIEQIGMIIPSKPQTEHPDTSSAQTSEGITEETEMEVESETPFPQIAELTDKEYNSIALFDERDSDESIIYGEPKEIGDERTIDAATLPKLVEKLTTTLREFENVQLTK